MVTYHLFYLALVFPLSLVSTYNDSLLSLSLSTFTFRFTFTFDNALLVSMSSGNPLTLSLSVSLSLSIMHCFSPRRVATYYLLPLSHPFVTAQYGQSRSIHIFFCKKYFLRHLLFFTFSIFSFHPMPSFPESLTVQRPVHFNQTCHVRYHSNTFAANSNQKNEGKRFTDNV